MLKDYEGGEIIENLGKEINELIDKTLEKNVMDRAFLEFKLTVDILNKDFTKSEGVVLIDDKENNKTYCHFCRRPSYFWINELCVCAKCYKEVENG